MTKHSNLTNIEAKHFGHYVYNLMNTVEEWDADTFDMIATYADRIGKPFDTTEG